MHVLVRWYQPGGVWKSKLIKRASDRNLLSVAAHRVSRLESPGRAVPFAFGIAAKIGRIIGLGDLQLNVEITLQILLHELDL